jgi:hypothetical protein
MKRVFRVTGQGKMQDAGLRGLATVPAAEDVDSMVPLSQALIPVGLNASCGGASEFQLERTMGLPELWQHLRGKSREKFGSS